MIWLLLFTLVAYFIATAPIVYSATSVHKISGIMKLWGYAPNQFLFLTVFYPFAAFCVLVAVYQFGFRLVPNLPPNFQGRSYLDHWAVIFLLGIIVAAIISIVVYYSSAWSFDKLKPRYAERAIMAFEDVNYKVTTSSLRKDEQNEFRKQLLARARRDLDELSIPTTQDSADIEEWLDALTPEVYLQVVQDREIQMRLKLLDPVLHVLNVFQIFSIILYGFCILAIAGFCIYCAQEIGYTGDNNPTLTQTINASFFAIFYFGLYSICYNQYRVQIESVVGGGTTVLQDVFVALLVIVLLVWLKTLDPSSREFSVENLIRFIPVILVGSGTAIGLLSPDIMRQLIGHETKMGTQTILAIVVILFSLIPIFQIIPRR